MAGANNNAVSLDHRADMMVKNENEISALDLSYKLGNLVKILLTRGANIKKEGFTNLHHYAITGQNPDVVRLILESGINVYYICEDNGTPL